MVGNIEATAVTPPPQKKKGITVVVSMYMNCYDRFNMQNLHNPKLMYTFASAFSKEGSVA